MAKLYRGRRSLRIQALKYWLWSAACFGVPLCLLVWQVAVGQENFTLDRVELYLPILLFLFGFYFLHRYRTFLAGARGETMVLRELKTLDDAYCIFMNYRIVGPRHRDEIDFLVVGETGVFVIEVKNHSGKISGAAKAAYWKQYKGKNQQGKPKQMKNPVVQTRRHAANVGNLLRRGKLSMWAEGILVFSNPAAELHITSDETPVFRSGKKVAEFIRNYRTTRVLTQGEVRQITAYLRQNGA